MGWTKGSGQKVFRIGQQTPASPKSQVPARPKKETGSTSFSDRTIILADIWLNYRDDEDFADFVEYNDLGLPLAYCYANGILTEIGGQAEMFINEAFGLLLAGLELDDTGFESLDDILDASSK
jgi:hypothetical protein